MKTHVDVNTIKRRYPHLNLSISQDRDSVTDKVFRIRTECWWNIIDFTPVEEEVKKALFELATVVVSEETANMGCFYQDVTSELRRGIRFVCMPEYPQKIQRP